MFKRLKFRSQQAALAVAAFATSSAVVLAVGGAFHSVSHEPFLADSPHARLVAARCDALRERGQRHDCVRQAVLQARARDAGARQLAAARAPAPAVGGQ